MKPFPTLILSWLTTGFGAVLLGILLGKVAGRPGLFLGSVLGGALGVLVAVLLARRFAWLQAPEAPGAFVGGLAGFAIAVPVTLTHMHGPVIPVLSCGLVGAGVLVGAGIARGWARR